MSSATNPKPVAGREMVYKMPISSEADEAGPGAPQGKGLTPRQVELNRLWMYYRCAQYEHMQYDWNGRARMSHLEHEAVSRGAQIPPGYYDQGQTTPLEFRRPSAPYHIIKIIVERFTGLLFSQKRHPEPEVLDDPETQIWLEGFAEASRIWPKMIQARNYAGAMGSVAIGFKFVDGKPIVELHDPRWCFPVFDDAHDPEKVVRMEKRYQFQDFVRNPETGEWVEGWFWYRRIIDRQRDIIWPKVPVEDNEEPDWDRYKKLEVVHAFNFCPVVWIQNMPVQDDVDGDPDGQGVFDMSDDIDKLIAQANRGIISNCDPTLTINSDGEWDDVSKGSSNALLLEKGGSAAYLEISGAGPTAARTQADELRKLAYEVARCVPPGGDQGGPARTQMEIERNYSAMIEKADVIREQFDEGLSKLFKMVLEAARTVGQARIIEVPNQPAIVQRGEVYLPLKREEDEDGHATFRERVMGRGEIVQLKWPSYFEPTTADAQSAVTLASAALTAKIITKETAVRFIAAFLNVTDPDAELKTIAAEEKAAGPDYDGMSWPPKGGGDFGA